MMYLLVVVGVHLLGVLNLELLGLRDVGSLLLHFRNRTTSEGVPSQYQFQT